MISTGNSKYRHTENDIWFSRVDVLRGRRVNREMFFITKEFTFDAAHNLTMYHGKCEKLHGHTYKLQVTVAGEKQEEDMVIDFLKMKEIVRDEVLSVLDHSYINDVLSQPTAENIAEWIFNKLSGKIRGNSFELYEVALWETPTSFVRYRERDGW